MIMIQDHLWLNYYQIIETKNPMKSISKLFLRNINHHNISFYICLKVIHGSFFAVMYSKTLLVTIRYRYWHIFKYIYRPYISREIAWLWSTFNIHTTLHICPSLSHCTKNLFCAIRRTFCRRGFY